MTKDEIRKSIIDEFQKAGWINSADCNVATRAIDAALKKLFEK